jgi:hypothetical protein
MALLPSPAGPFIRAAGRLRSRSNSDYRVRKGPSMPPTVPESFSVRMIFPCDLLDNSLICGCPTVGEEVDVEVADDRQTIAAIAAKVEAIPTVRLR